jgi:Subtilase family/RTX calcium-binding nonapeptide repeat (4 copies)
MNPLNSFRNFTNRLLLGPGESISNNHKSSNQSQGQSVISVASVSYQSKSYESGETLPWGIQAVWQGEDISKRGNFASESYAFVIDSGVSDKTDDLNLNKDWARSWVYTPTGLQSPFSDVNGHGTHIAGVIGALVNGKGIIGVSPGAQIVSLKVNNDFGFGDGNTTAEAVNYAANIINDNKLDKKKCVINLSLVSYSRDPKLESAILRAADQGIQFTIAAGNFGKDVDNFAPACIGNHPNVYVVSAVDSSNQVPFWSNYDRLDTATDADDVDYAAPGVNILSYYKNGQLGTLSGTSQAAPHLAGLLITGGVQAGNMVKSNYANTADPFVISATQSLLPQQVQPAAKQSPPTYNLASSATINEGQTLKIDIATTNLTKGTPLYWSISGNGISTNDFTGLSDLKGNLSIDAKGNATVSFNLKNDLNTEGTESIKFELFSDSARSIKVGDKSAEIQDTSKTPLPSLTLWGTNGNDIITGGAGDDFIAGVARTGTDLTSMGRGQFDILTGGLGKDVFLVGDSRGTFYDDGITSNHGANDYALIKDFKAGEDKIQVKKGQGVVWKALDANVLVYYDLNRNRGIETSGPNRDDLIAILEGVTTLDNSDILVAR